jgi:hypothetical protein
MFCAPGLVFYVAKGVGSRFHVLRTQSRFQWYRRRRVPLSFLRFWTRFLRWGGRRVPFSCFARQFSFWAVLSPSDPVFMFCAPRLIFGATEGVGSRFHILRSWTRFPWYRWRRVPFSCFELPDSCLEVWRVSGPVYIFSVPGLIFDGSKGVGSRFHVFARPNSFFGCTEGVGSRFQVLRFRTRFRRYRGRRVPFSCFALPTSFSAVTMASAPDFIF